MDKQELLTAIKAGHDRLESMLSGLTDEQLIERPAPDAWSIKDILAHLTFWQQSMVTNLKRLQNGQPGEYLAGELDDVNAQVYSANVFRPPELVLGEYGRSYDDMLVSIQACSDDDLNDPGRFSFRQGKPLYEYILGESTEHYTDHEGDIRTALEHIRANKLKK
jgi:hypothetical protein